MARHAAALQERAQLIASHECVRLLCVYEGEAAVRFLLSRPEKLIVPTLLTLADVRNGVKAVAALLTHMSPVQAARCDPQKSLFRLGLGIGMCFVGWKPSHARAVP